MEHHELIQKELLQKIKDRRIKLHISQQDLAEMAGISRMNYVRIEREDYSLSLKTLIKICSVLGLRLQIEEN